MSSIFSSNYTVAIGDINYGGHLGNDKALVIFQEARLHFLYSMGLSELDIGEGLGIILVEANVQYLKEVFHGDILKTSIRVKELLNKKFILEYQVERESDKKTVLTGTTSFLSFDHSKRRVVTMPEDFRQQLGPFLVEKY